MTRFEGSSDFIHDHATTVAVSDQPLHSPPVDQVIPVPPQRHSGLVFVIGVGYTF